MKYIKFTSLALATGLLILLGSFYLPRGASKAEDFNCPDGTFLNIDLAKGPSCVPPVQIPVQTPVQSTPQTVPQEPASDTTGCR